MLIFAKNRTMTVEQFLKLMECDQDDEFEVACILMNCTQEQRAKLLTQPLSKINKMVSKMPLPILDIENNRIPKCVRIGCYLYSVPEDFNKLSYGKFLDIGALINDLKEEIFAESDHEATQRNMFRERSIKLIPEVCSIIFDVSISKVMTADAFKIIPIGSFFLRSFFLLSQAKQKLEELNIQAKKSEQG